MPTFRRRTRRREGTPLLPREAMTGFALLAAIGVGVGAAFMVDWDSVEYKGARITQTMPPRSGPELVGNSLLTPPPASVAVAPPAAPALPGAAPVTGVSPAAPTDTPPAPPPAVGASVPAGTPSAAPSQAAAAASTPVVPSATAVPVPPPMAPPLAPPEERPAPPARGEKLPPPSFDSIPKITGEPWPLPDAPFPDLQRRTPNGVLPVVDGKGREPWKAYAKPFENKTGGPLVAIVLTDLGLNKVATEAAIEKMPAEVTLSFSPYTKGLQNWINVARRAGHEVMIDLPMEPPSFPARDPGPYALLTALTIGEVMQRVETLMARGGGYVGFLGTAGSPFTHSEMMPTVLGGMAEHGLMYLGDSSAEADGRRPPLASVASVVDENMFRGAVDARLGRVVALAKERGGAVAVASSKPLSLERLRAFIADLPKQGVTLAPASALAQPPAPAGAAK